MDYNLGSKKVVRLYIWNIRIGLIPGGKKSFAQVDLEIYMPSRTRRCLCTQLLSVSEVVWRLTNIWIWWYVKVKGKGNSARSLQIDCRIVQGDTAFLRIRTKCSHISSFLAIIGVITLYSETAVLLSKSICFQPLWLEYSPSHTGQLILDLATPLP